MNCQLTEKFRHFRKINGLILDRTFDVLQLNYIMYYLQYNEISRYSPEIGVIWSKITEIGKKKGVANHTRYG